jgi:hypothetical protein
LANSGRSITGGATRTRSTPVAEVDASLLDVSLRDEVRHRAHHRILIAGGAVLAGLQRRAAVVDHDPGSLAPKRDVVVLRGGVRDHQRCAREGARPIRHPDDPGGGRRGARRRVHRRRDDRRTENEHGPSSVNGRRV